MNKNEVEKLLERLQQYDYYVVYKLVDLTTGERRGICQTSVYHNVELGECFKFWSDKDKDITLYLDSNIESQEWNNDELILHIIDCTEVINIKCRKR